MKRVLSIDGGGIRGLIPAMVCAKIEELARAPIRDLFDLVAGTSTGGIIAMGLALPEKPMKADDLVTFYARDGVDIFSRPRRVTRYIRPKYTNNELRRVVNNVFGQSQMRDALTEILVTSYDIKHRVPVYFSRRLARDNDGDNHFMRDVAIATAAAPTYFPPYELNSGVMVDGGIVANNPASLALAEARRFWPTDDLLLVSLGTGRLSKPHLFKRAQKWGMLRWASPLIDCIFDGNAKATEDVLKLMMPAKRYWRFQYGLSESTETLDCVSQESLAGLRQVATEILSHHESDLSDLTTILTQPGPPTNSAQATSNRDIGRVEETRFLIQRIEQGVQRSMTFQNPIFLVRHP